jgi:hypothetical protein
MLWGFCVYKNAVKPLLVAAFRPLICRYPDFGQMEGRNSFQLLIEQALIHIVEIPSACLAFRLTALK